MLHVPVLGSRSTCNNLWAGSGENPPSDIFYQNHFFEFLDSTFPEKYKAKKKRSKKYPKWSHALSKFAISLEWDRLKIAPGNFRRRCLETGPAQPSLGRFLFKSAHILIESAHLVNFSLQGLQLVAPNYLAKRNTMHVDVQNGFLEKHSAIVSASDLVE